MNKMFRIFIAMLFIFSGCKNSETPTDNTNHEWTLNYDNSMSFSSLYSSNGIVIAGTWGKGLFLSTDNGNSWSQAKLLYKPVYSLTACKGNILSGTNKGIYISPDNGDNWNIINNGLPDSLLVSAFTVNGNNVFAGTNNGIFISNDNGLNWTSVNNGLPLYPNNYVRSLAFNGNVVFAGLTDPFLKSGNLYISKDKGNSWSSVNNELTGKCVEAIVIDGNNIFAGTTEDGIYRSTDNGNTWTQINKGLMAKPYVFCILIMGKSIYIGTQEGVYLSNDYGENWNLSSGLKYYGNVYDLTVNGNRIFAATDYGIWQLN